MTSGTSVVTPERFASGISSYKEWMEAITQNKELFQRHYDEYTPNPDDAAAIKRMVQENGVKALILGEDWCPDVWRGLSVLCKVGESTGMEVRMFKRDENKDIMAEFLKEGEFESIPTIVFYDRNQRYLCHWIERAEQATREMADVRKRVMPEVMPERDTPEWREVTRRSRDAMIDAAGPWRDAQTTEMRQMLEKALA